MYWWTKSSALTSSRGEFPAIAALLMMMSIWNLPDLRKISESAFPSFGQSRAYRRMCRGTLLSLANGTSLAVILASKVPTLGGRSEFWQS